MKTNSESTAGARGSSAASRGMVCTLSHRHSRSQGILVKLRDPCPDDQEIMVGGIPAI